MAMQINVLLATLLLGVVLQDASAYKYIGDPAKQKWGGVESSPHVVLEPELLSSKVHPTKQKLPEIWCHAKRRNTGNTVKALNITGAVFWRTSANTKEPVEYTPRLEFDPKINVTKAILDSRDINITEVGSFRCDLFNGSTENFYSYETIFVQARPVFLVHHVKSYEISRKEHNTVIAPKVTTREGETAWLDCEVVGYPSVKITWPENPADGSKRKQESTTARSSRGAKASEQKDVERTEKSENSTKLVYHRNGTLEIRNVTKEDLKRYYCFAENKFAVTGKKATIFNATMVYEVALAREFGPYDWITPLAIIAVMVILLIAIIYGCSIVQKHKREDEAKANETTQQDGKLLK